MLFVSSSGQHHCGYDDDADGYDDGGAGEGEESGDG